jgi:hypothetical protein
MGDVTMKRAFLFGLGSFLILVIIGLLVRHDTPSVIMALVLMLVSVIAIRAAVGAPPSYSRLHAALGWLLGSGPYRWPPKNRLRV